MEDILLKGQNRQYKNLAGSISTKSYGIKKEFIRESFYTPGNDPHRLELVSRVYDVDYINDSASTNINSTWYALESVEGPVIWIAGGVEKGNGYSSLDDLVLNKVRAIIGLDTPNDRLLKYFEGKGPEIFDTWDIKEAVEFAYKLSGRGDTVLFSPACDICDLFESYVDRGEQFRRQVFNLGGFNSRNPVIELKVPLSSTIQEISKGFESVLPKTTEKKDKYEPSNEKN